MQGTLFFFILLIGYAVQSLGLRQQSIGAVGKLKCGAKPATGVKVMLWDEDDGPDRDDVLDEGITDRDGKFDLEGGTHEMTSIDPVLKIYHNCDDDMTPGKRKVKLILPKSYIVGGSIVKKKIDIGELNLEVIYSGEERKLF